MRISLGTNISALNAARRLGETSSSLGSTFQRLSSGQRINDASDDSASLSILTSLNLDKRLATVAIRGASDGLSVTSIAIDGISEIIQILSRMNELAEQSANGTYNNTQRSALAAEFQALAQESERTSATLQFNNVTLLSNSADLYIQVGLHGAGSANSILIPRTSATLQSIGIKDIYEQLTVSIIGNTLDVSASVSRNSMPTIEAAIETLTQRRSVLAAAESRLHTAVNYLAVSRDETAQAASRIGDADIAAESAQLVRLQILQNAGAAILAQANQQPALALKLLT